MNGIELQRIETRVSREGRVLNEVVESIDIREINASWNDIYDAFNPIF